MTTEFNEAEGNESQIVVNAISQLLLGLLVLPKLRQSATQYNVSKLVELLFVRELATRTSASSKPGNVIVNIVNPGWVITNMTNGGERRKSFMGSLATKLLARKTEVSSRTVVHGAHGGLETHGQYLSDCKIGTVSAFVSSDEGAEVQTKLWLELSDILDKVEPGVMDIL
ncbi:short-chain dehydrogenase, putative [Talaromyces stipitatus ATCC 10500]|uniref:Short-chain dehydrogenase, putative n=1 Tax=Talaromyces stipitatus (strain ATCC 10500 / CBS 375.48 / QM 6759 / NRRL 1006) TaxID=441959 RepID=B8MNA7_TALSN|nr:short-chain dehydrogenase, putative [Talaromyces stipitatus ATCC 10500]EED13996.1 short-chain dehydrogenase, putative [Talaromyces stipitatus ATCC 10500]